MRINGLKLHQGRFRLDMRDNFFPERLGQVFEQAAEGCGGIAVLETFKNPVDVTGGMVWRYGLMVNMVVLD